MHEKYQELAYHELFPEYLKSVSGKKHDFEMTFEHIVQQVNSLNFLYILVHGNR